MPSTVRSTVVVDSVFQPENLPAPVQHEWHWPEYGCELAGTAWNVFIGLSAVVFNFAVGMPGARMIPNASLRLWVTGLIFAGSGSLFAISPWGRLSGAHINPSVTLGFWAQGKVHRHDLFGYLVAQILGGSLGAWLLIVLWGQHAVNVNHGMTLPGSGYTARQAFLAELAMTFAYILAIFYFVSRPRLLRWTPLMNWLGVAGLVWLGAAVSGTSLNPARSFGPALAASHWRDLWIYLVAPPLGALLAVGCFRLILRERRLLAAKLSHSPYYRSIFRAHSKVAAEDKTRSC